MNHYSVNVTIFAPYPIEKTFTILASHVSTAISRAVKDAYNAIDHKRRIDSYLVKAHKV